MDVRRQFNPAGDDATLHGGVLGEPQKFRMVRGSGLFNHFADGVVWLPKRGVTISAQPGMSPRT